jgi:predicted nuclease of restriction endonuclease-like RecB superfamily
VLTPDLVGARRRGEELRLGGTDDARRARIEALAGALAAVARAHVGRTRDELGAALDEAAAAHAPPGDRRLGDAVAKLVTDGCRFEETAGDEVSARRRDLFRRAAAARRAATPTAPFDRAAVLAAAADAAGTTAAALEAGLFADRPGAQRLAAVELAGPAALARGFPLAEAQAVLLRASKVRAAVRARDAATLRHLFRTLKFLRLLPLISASPGGEIVLELDGPLSLFQGGTRYGLQLGLALPAIAACDAWAIDADVRWGAERRPLRFRLAGPLGAPAPADAGAPELPEEIAKLVVAFDRLESGWRIDREPAVLDLPGAGLCVPDLAFTRARDRARVYFELLGFWSREAVWRRVELVRAGLPHRILFAASRALRVGEAVLEDSAHAALYVFARVLSAREILARLERLADQP